MGVPSFYRWLVGNYPNIVVSAIEEEGEWVDTSQPNPNGMEFDNLYLDMNGIIHPCFHPEDQLFPPTTYDEVFTALFRYVDRIFRIVRPRSLLYMAVDGVAPRAKMNQQRSRRFKTAKDAEIAEVEEEKLRDEFEKEGKKVLPKQEYEVSDPSVITPGTVFMERLSKALEYYTRSRLNSDPGWKSVKVIISDASVPGEGEHKIMSFIRLQRNLPGYNPDTRHCLYGQDADLIILALAMHEMHFSILREDVLKQGEQSISVSSVETSFSRKEFNMVKSRGWFGRVLAARGAGASPKRPYQFLNVWTLREYLVLDMMPPNPPFEIDIERVVDDFIFICLFTGNDFLPHLPTLEIREGGIDLLIAVYKKLFKKMDDYLINTSKIKEKKASYIEVKRVEQFILEVGSYEDRIFKKRYKLRQKSIHRWLLQSLKEGDAEDDFDNLRESSGYGFHKSTSPSFHTFDQSRLQEETCTMTSGSDTLSSVFSEHCTTSDESDVIRNTKELKQKLKDILGEKVDLFKNGEFNNDKVKLGVPGWKGRYYREKFSAETPAEIESTRKEIVHKYMEGICWVLQYYFAGVCSWCWYYPFNYGPFASDLKCLSCSDISFKIGSPFKPFDHLMAVLPSRSSNALPNTYRQLMNSEDSPIIKFYPTDFSVDKDGKRFSWQGVAKLPLIDEGLLLKETSLLEKHLEIDEMERNNFRYDKMIVMDSHSLGRKICLIYELPEPASERTGKDYPIDCTSCEISGFLSLCVDYSIRRYFCSPIKGLMDITDDHSISAVFKNPDYHDHVSKLLANVTLPDKTIKESDIFERRLWHEHEGSQQHNISQHMYAPRAIVARESDSHASTHEICNGPDSGWSVRGCGNKAIGRGRGIYSGGNPARSIGRGHGSMEVRPFGQRGSASGGNRALPGNQGSRGYGRNLNTSSYGGYQARAGGFQQPTAISTVDRSEGWRSRSAPMAAECARGRGRGWPPSSSPSYGWGAGPRRFDSHGSGERGTGW